MINLEWYRSFIEVYRVGTVSGAAQVLFITQPAVSQHIAALESALSQKLFQRMPRKMLPTDEGKRLYTQIVEAMEKLESITTQITATEIPQLIRIGTPQEFFTERILQRLPQAENLLYRIQLGLTQDLIEQLLKGQLDVVVATQKITRSELEYQLIYQENFWLVAPPETVIPIPPESLQVDLTPLEQWLRGQPLIAYSEELPIIRRFWRVVFGRRLDVVPRLVLPDLQMIRQAIASGFGFSVLPDYLCEEMVNSQALTLILKPMDAVSNQIWLAYRKSERQSPKIKLLLDTSY
jgi:DNA-binding transcriptional LysR family regulator